MISRINHPSNPPDAVLELAARLEDAGHATWWVGESLHDALRGVPGDSYSLTTRADPSAIANLLPTAVPTRPRAAAFVVPSPAGPIDLAPLRSSHGIEADLAQRGFSVLALAWRLGESSLVDPHGGEKDLLEGRLRCVGDAERNLRESPIRVLQAARLVATRGYSVDEALPAAMTEVWRRGAAKLAATDLRREFNGLLLSRRPGAGVALLQACGIDRILGFQAHADCGNLLDAAPPDRALRWAIWLRGRGGRRCLYRVRLDYTLSRRVRRLLDHHPIEEVASPRRRSSLRRLLARLEAGEREQLFALSEAELGEQSDSEASERRGALEEMRVALEREERALLSRRDRIQLGLDGLAVARILGIEPGPEVGRALAFLNARIANEPDLNTPERLADLLRDWATEPSQKD